jgi:hypothetical protein
MKKLGFLMLMLALALMLGGNALAQNTGDNSDYFVTYFSNANTTGAPDAVVRFINDGDTENNLWADYYVFDDSQELQECCSCIITPDGLNSEYVNKVPGSPSLTGNTLTGVLPTRGVIKVISDGAQPSGNPFAPVPTPGLRGWGVHVQALTKTTYAVTETRFADSNLSASEQQLLGELCQFATILGSGHGTCTCSPEDYDF